MRSLSSTPPDPLDDRQSLAGPRRRPTGATARSIGRDNREWIRIEEEAVPEPIRLSPGDPAPDFTLPDAAGTKISLGELRGRRVILYAYPAAMTPGCTKQACDFRDNIGRLAAAGFTVLGVSPDPPAKLAKFRDRDAVPFPLLSDTDRTTLTAYGAYGEKTMYGKAVTGVIRSTFVIDAEGRIELAQYGVKATGHVERLMRELGV